MVVAGPALGALAAFAAMCFLVFLYYAYGYSLGALLQKLAAFFDSLGVSLGWLGRISLSFIGDGILAIDHAIRQALGAGIIATRSAGLYLWHYVAYAATEVGDTIADLAEATERAIGRAVTVTVPAYVTNRLTWLSARVGALAAQVEAIAARAPRVVTHEITRVKPVVVHEAAVAAHAITLPGIKPLERELGNLQAKAREWSKLLTLAGIAGLIGATIFREFNLGWLRCRGVNRVGKGLCGLSGIIESLFADALDVLLVANLCQMTTLMEKGAKAFEPELAYLVSLTDGLAKCRGVSLAASPAVAWYEPPPAENLVSL